MVGQNLVFRLDENTASFTNASRGGRVERIQKPLNGQCARYVPCYRRKSRDCNAAPQNQGSQRCSDDGRLLVSFNLDAFRSYGKEQNLNAPVSQQATFAYTTALNHLLRFGSHQKVQIGDATTVFWTERSSPIEDFMGNILDPRGDASIDAADAKKFRTISTLFAKGSQAFDCH